MITSAEVKTLLQITSSDYDTLIATLIPIIEDDITNYTGNFFTKVKSSYYTGYLNYQDLVFDSGDDETITTSITNSEYYFSNNYAIGDRILIEGSVFNDGVYTVSGSADKVLTVSETVVDETIDDKYLVSIKYIEYPQDLKLIAADMINYRIKNIDKSVSRESIGDYSITYNNDIMFGSYPNSILMGLNKYRVLGVK